MKGILIALAAINIAIFLLIMTVGYGQNENSSDNSSGSVVRPQEINLPGEETRESNPSLKALIVLSLIAVGLFIANQTYKILTRKKRIK